MNLKELLKQVQDEPNTIEFQTVMRFIEQHYDYTPRPFQNGVGENPIDNAAGSNEGSCKIFAFARLNNLGKQQTLACFGDYYRTDVLQYPENNDHSNIRRFMRDGWAGIHFESLPFT